MMFWQLWPKAKTINSEVGQVFSGCFPAELLVLQMKVVIHNPVFC